MDIQSQEEILRRHVLHFELVEGGARTDVIVVAGEIIRSCCERSREVANIMVGLLRVVLRPLSRTLVIMLAAPRSRNEPYVVYES
jgi:hypothetical protein